jgi:hypothetical protein
MPARRRGHPEPGTHLGERLTRELAAIVREHNVVRQDPASYQRNTCAATDNYLLTLALPAPDTHCPA